MRPHEPHTPMPRAPREESSDFTHFSAKRQRDKRPQLSNSMHARLGPQEPRRPRPPAATAWEVHPDPMVTPMVQNVLLHRDPIVTPMVQNDNLGETSQMSYLLSPSAKGWTTCSPRLSALISFITSPQGDSSYPNSPHTMGPATPSIILCIIDSS